jgi:hypothetical protein
MIHEGYISYDIQIRRYSCLDATKRERKEEFDERPNNLGLYTIVYQEMDESEK